MKLIFTIKSPRYGCSTLSLLIIDFMGTIFTIYLAIYFLNMELDFLFDLINIMSGHSRTVRLLLAFHLKWYDANNLLLTAVSVIYCATAIVKLRSTYIMLIIMRICTILGRLTNLEMGSRKTCAQT